MVEIIDLEVEWATVSRMRHLFEHVNTSYEITQAFTIFTGILCWTLQRIRCADDGSEMAQRMKSLKAKLNSDSLYSFLPEDVLSNITNKTDQKLLKNLSALDFVTLLRDAVAHGDARVVSPINLDHQLTGFRISLKNRRNITITVELDRRSMRFIAEKVSKCFCDACSENQPNSFLYAADKISEIGQGNSANKSN